MSGKISAQRVVLTSFFVDISDVVLNITIAILSGSVVMLAQALEGVSDLVSSGLLVIGLERSRQPADKKHPFGHGRELYFWTLLAALVMFAFTASLSFYLGLQRFLNPEPIQRLSLTYLVLIFSVFTNGYAFSLSYRRLIGKRNFSRIWQTFFRSALVETKTTLILDLMGTLASVLGLAALLVFGLTKDLRFDGIGAMLIGAVLGILAYFLLLAVKDLLIGRSTTPEVEEKIRNAVLDIKEVEEVLDLRTMILGPEKLLVNIEVHIKDNLTTNTIEKLMDRIKQHIQEEVPTVKHIQIELETPDKELT